MENEEISYPQSLFHERFIGAVGPQATDLETLLAELRGPLFAHGETAERFRKQLSRGRKGTKNAFK